MSDRTAPRDQTKVLFAVLTKHISTTGNSYLRGLGARTNPPPPSGARPGCSGDRYAAPRPESARGYGVECDEDLNNAIPF